MTAVMAKERGDVKPEPNGKQLRVSKKQNKQRLVRRNPKLPQPKRRRFC